MIARIRPEFERSFRVELACGRRNTSAHRVVCWHSNKNLIDHHQWNTWHGKQTLAVCACRPRVQQRSFVWNGARGPVIAKSISVQRERFPGWLSGKYCSALGYRFTYTPTQLADTVSYVTYYHICCQGFPSKKYLS